MPFSINHQPSAILPALQPALRTLKLPIRHPTKGLNLIGERLAALLNLNGRGQIDEDLIGRYLQAVAIRMAGLGKPWKQITDAEILAEVGVRKVIIAAGKSTRFSSGLARKQLTLSDGYSTLLLHARQAVGIHCCPDVIAVDAVVAWKCLRPREITKAAFEKALNVIDMPKRIKQNISCALDPSERGDRLPACQPLRRDPEANLQTIREIFSDNLSRSAKTTTDQFFDDFLHALMQPIVDASDIPLRRCPETGEDVLLALAKPWGPGEALIAGMARLKKLKLAGQTKYVMPIYSDYAPALLPNYSPIYLQAYMEAVIKDATITIGAKSPLDKVKDRGNIIFTDHRVERGERREERGGRPEPIAIREWRDMTKEEQAECERRLQQSRDAAQTHSHTPTPPHSHTSYHGLNAGVFVIDLAWAARQATRQHKEFDHPDPVKGKEHEYWYTDLVEIAAKQRKPRHVVFLGPDAPSGCKDAERIRQYHEEVIEATKEVLLDLGVQLDPSARVRLRSTSPTFSIESAARKIFGEQDESLAAERQDHVHIYGDVFIEDEVTIGRGVMLDGRSKPVYLEGETYVGDGANITGSHVSALVVPGEHLKGVERSRHFCGAALIHELAPKDQEGILRFIRSEIENFLSRLKNKGHRDLAFLSTEQLWQRPKFLERQTAESLYRHAFAWLCSSTATDPFAAEKKSELSALRPLVNEHWARLARHDFAEPDITRKLFKDLTLLATQANLFDWQSPTVRALLGSDSGTPTLPHSRTPTLPSLSSSRLAIDHYAEYEAMVFGAPSTFLYLTDNVGETLFDTLIWFMLCELGHKVVVAAKDKPAGGDATVKDVMSIVQKRKALKKHFEHGNLRVISNGNDTYGTFLDRLPEEFFAVYRDPSLRAIIGKGQANFYTTVVRNKLDAPFVAQFLVKGMTAEKTTGIRLRHNKEGKKVPRPVIAIIQPGECVTEVAPGMPGARTLKEMVNG